MDISNPQKYFLEYRNINKIANNQLGSNLLLETEREARSYLLRLENNSLSASATNSRV